MTIKQVEQQTGISKQNIRFYEKEGLLQPARNPDNGYRTYTAEHVAALQEIKLFRKLGISIEDIRKMQQGVLPISRCMEKYAAIAALKLKELAKQKALFEKLSEQTAENNVLDVQEALAELEANERSGIRVFNIAYDFLTKAANHLGKGIENMLFKKGFDLELDDGLTYPSSETICEAVLAYCKRTGESCTFESTKRPVSFLLNGIRYHVQVQMTRGGYYLHCKEE